MYKGFKFGFIENLIVAVFAIVGINIDKLIGSNLGLHGALYGALIGHTFSHMLAGMVEFGWKIALNMALGCLSVIVLVYIYFLFTEHDTEIEHNH
tara:strand:+ start:66623 stop:66907 length:285 start_codon:yes stop_codon:yes gene_type:complete